MYHNLAYFCMWYCWGLKSGGHQLRFGSWNPIIYQGFIRPSHVVLGVPGARALRRTNGPVLLGVAAPTSTQPQLE